MIKFEPIHRYELLGWLTRQTARSDEIGEAARAWLGNEPVNLRPVVREWWNTRPPEAPPAGTYRCAPTRISRFAVRIFGGPYDGWLVVTARPDRETITIDARCRAVPQRD
jgi:hypothetical protein